MNSVDIMPADLDSRLPKKPHFQSGVSLKTKFILITTLFIIILMCIIGYVAVTREKAILYDEFEKKGKLLGETLAIPIINDLIYERLGIVEEGGLLDNYIMEIFNKRDVDLLYIMILTEEGKVISHNNVTEYGKIYSDPLTAKALNSDHTVIQRFSSRGQDALDFGAPLSIGKKRWGTLKFAISLERMEDAVEETVMNIIMLTVVFIAAGFVMVLLLSRRFISPITQLAGTMEKTGGDYLEVRVNVKGNDELAVLGEKFNSMIERIKLTNEELKKTHESMVQSEKLASIGILAAGVAHEINNPLGALFNCHYLMKQEGGDPARREKYLNFMREGLERIESTVNKLLWMSRKSEKKPVNADVRSTVESVYSFIEYKLNKNKIDFVNETPENLRVYIDLHDFQQTLLNLFINAIYAMENGGALKITGRQADSGVKIEVSDTGSGISQETLKNIFDPFFTTKPAGEGTGLGLWLTYEIVKSYNGDITVESEEGKGTKFVVTMPAGEAA